ncbi:MAG: porin [Rhodocyclales bacterium]|nr:porin [Rhodocyclales bacterium]
MHVSLSRKAGIAAAASLSLSGAALAQSNVSLYGIVDAGYVYSSGERSGDNSNANFSGINSGVMAGSRLGFKGEENLGNGLKTVFVLEYALNVDTNAGVGTALARQQFIGLNSAKLGQVAFGRQYAPGYLASARNHAFGGSTVQGPLAILTGAAGNSITAAAVQSRINNSVSYTSPNWSGLTASAIYGFGEGGGTGADGISQGNNGFFGAGLNYARGPLNLDLLFQQRIGVASNPVATTPVTTVAAQKNINEWALMGAYDFKVAKLFGTYQHQDDDNGSSTREGSNHTWSIGATVPVFGNGLIQASYVRLEWDRRGAGGSDGWALGYRHALSKRTTLYTTYTLIDNDRTTLAAAGPISNTARIGEANGTFTAGLNHTF